MNIPQMNRVRKTIAPNGCVFGIENAMQDHTNNLTLQVNFVTIFNS